MKVKGILNGISGKAKILAAAVVGLAGLAFPLVALAADGEPGPLVPKCRGSGGVSGACGYNDLITLGQNFLTWAIYLVALVSVASIAYAGFLYLSSAGDEGKIKQAHGIFTKVIWGIVITLAAWLIVHSVLAGLGVDSDFSLLN